MAPLTEFLDRADLTTSGLGSPTVRLWLQRDECGRIVGSSGYELSDDGKHALVRSVAVDASHRSAGQGMALARFALHEAAAEGATTAWLFSRRSGPFWQRLGFEPADRDEMAAVLGGAHQVQLFLETGQFDREMAWRRPLAG